MFLQHFVHGLGTKSIEYMYMTFGGIFVHCTVEEGKSILDRIHPVTPLEDLQIEALLISVDEPIITYLDASEISALPAREELLQLTTPRIGSKNEIEDLSYPVFMPKPSTHRMHDPGSNVPHVQPKGFTENQMS
jgi:hypothetical protein